MKRREWTHAGGIVVRVESGRPEFLLVSSRRNSSTWVLPKGHIESDETAKATAVREVREESGVVAEVLRGVGEARYRRDGVPIAVRYFAMRPLAVKSAQENRSVEWCDRAEARARLPYPEVRKLLDKAAAVVVKTAAERR